MAGELTQRLLDDILSRLEGRTRPLVVGICGAQGSGKTTVSDHLARALDSLGIITSTISIDDLYLGRAERQRLATEVHPLLATRGVPGTHDVELGLSLMSALDAGTAAPLPRFDKSIDDRAPSEGWPVMRADTSVLLFEGWCVGAVPERPADLLTPINQLETREDSDGIWRAYVNACLAGDYQLLFGRIDLLVLLAAPGFEVVHGWRLQQEHELRARTGGGMDDSQIGRFISHYERLTRHILSEMPGRADIVVRLGKDRSVAEYLDRTVGQVRQGVPRG